MLACVKRFSKEQDNLARQISRLDNCNLQEMVGSRVFWYRRKSQQYRASFRWCSALFLLLQAGIAIIGGFPDSRYIVLVPALAVFGILVRGIIDLWHMQDNWKRYRKTLEQIRDELDLYINKAGRYSWHSNQDELNRKLTERIVELCSNENSEWAKQKYTHKG